MESSLVSLYPEDILTFTLQSDSQTKTSLKITNTSSSRIAFKVKTTQPTVYYVRPNQSFLEVGQSEDIAIAIVDTECGRLIEQYRSNVMEKLEKHRFLVLTKVVSDAEYDRIMEGNATNKQEELSKIWSSSSGNGKDDKRSLKLNVEYIYPRKGGTPSKPSKQTNSTLGGANNSSNTAVAVSTAAGISSHHAASNLNTQNTSSSASSSSDLKEIQELKVKYDAIVEYTVHLAAERDMIVTQLETLKKEYNNEIYKKKSESKSRTEEEKKHVPVVHTGYSIVVLIIIAILSFLLGRFFLHI